LVETERQVVGNEEVFERAGQRSGGSARTAGPFQQRLGVSGLSIAQQAAEAGDDHARSPHAMPLSGEVGEVSEPPRRILECVGQVVGLVPGPVRVLLPAAAA
jgi:hypothetical protein